jgi:hypothetical protein
MSKDTNKEEDKRQHIPVYRHETKDKVYESIALGNSTPAFLVYDNKNKKWGIVTSIEDIEVVYVPLHKDCLPYIPYRIPKKQLDKLISGTYKPNKQELFDKILDQIKLFIDVKEEDQILIVAEIFETYIQHKLSALGYLFMEGERGSGKSNACRVIADLSYRAMYSADTNAADIYNYVGTDEANEAQMTIIEDEVNWTKLTPNLARKMKIYRTGYKEGTVVPRILDGSKSSRKMGFYRTFCSKVFAGYGFPNDPAFEQRCIPIQFVEGEPISDEITKEDRKKFEEIKFELLLWRMYNYFDPLPEFEYHRIRKRNKEIWKCKILALHEIEEQETIVEMAHKNVKERIETRSNSLEAHVVRAVKAQMEEGLFELDQIPFAFVWRQLLRDLEVTVVDAYLDSKYTFVSEITQSTVSRKEVGRKLKALIRGKSGLKRIRILEDVKAEPHRVWSFDNETVNKLFESFKLKQNEIEEFDELEPIQEGLEDV